MAEATFLAALDEELRPVCAVFVDLVGSTQLGERLGLVEAKQILQDCVGLFCDRIESFGGEVTSHAGDGVAAFFGLHTSRPDDAERAARAACAILGCFTSGELSGLSVGGAPLAVRIGLHKGRTVVGHLGGRAAVRTAMGDPVNVAARLEGAAKANSILMSADIAKELPEGSVFRPEGDIQIRGRGVAVETYSLVSVGVESFERAASSTTAIVGRTRELDLIRQAGAKVTKGASQLIGIVGKAGLGKTLLTEVLSREVSDATVLAIRCRYASDPEPFSAIGALLVAWIGTDQGSRIASRLRLRRQLEELNPDDELSDAEAFLARAMEVEEWGGLLGARDVLEIPNVSKEMQRAALRWLVSLSKSRPLMLVLDDVHYADAPSVEVLLAALRMTDEGMISIGWSTCPDTYSPGWALLTESVKSYFHRFSLVELEELEERDAVALLVSGSNPETRESRRRASRLVDVMGGNPGFLLSCWRAGVDVGKTQDDVLPADVEGTVLAQLGLLSSPARRLARGMAVLRGPLEERFLECVFDGGVRQGLRELVRSGLVTEHSRFPVAIYEIDSEVVRMTLDASVAPAVREELHRKALGSLERLVDEWEVRAPNGRLLHHARHTGDLELVGKFAAACAREGLGAGNLEYAAERLKEAANAAEELGQKRLASSAHEKRTLVLAALGRLGEAKGAYVAACACAPPETVTEVRFRLLEGFLFFGAHGFVWQELEEGNLRQGDSWADYLRAFLALRRNRWDEALMRSVQVRLCAPKADLVARSLWVEAGALCELGRFDDAATAMRRRADLLWDSGDHWAFTEAMVEWGVVECARGHLVSGTGLLETCFELSRDAGRQSLAARAGVNYLYGLLLRGNLLAARNFGRALVAIVKDPYWLAAAYANLGSVYLEGGELAEARSAYESALDLADGETPNVAQALGARIRRAGIDILEGELEAGVEAIQDAIETCRAVRARDSFLVAALCWLAVAELSAGDEARAISLAEEARVVAGMGDPASAALAGRVLGRALRGSEFGRAEAVLNEALGLARQMGMRLEEGRCLAELGLLRGAAGRDELATARSIFEECGAEGDLASLPTDGSTVVGVGS